ncbi:hypothetical protein IT568_09805, partial [bacterium]|nr:hypothetical protein [bacterium]
MKKILLILSAIFVLVVVSIVVAVKIMFPPEKIRAILVPEIETALNGRKVEVGEISLALFGG